ncbi:hypothetical protein [Hyphomicrobium sp.]|jgi:hypothetical protein|uniref:hypothetical protein n=1 Tax=Hyphomicrobium sp. TaxID=82 RepID=UPI002D136321|nr:hypothetical protein [Hyphomicrobium sp.]HVZ06187.1 hypothetical protein [Hyphomicrobium sp.]
MSDLTEKTPRNISPYYSFFQTLFETIDTASLFWQPLLRAIGSSQLEVAGLQARQAQAMVHWTHELMRFGSPIDVAGANARLWQTMLGNCVDAAPRVAAAASCATQSVPIALPLPASRPRDALILLDRERRVRPADEKPLERKVA